MEKKCKASELNVHITHAPGVRIMYASITMCDLEEFHDKSLIIWM